MRKQKTQITAVTQPATRRPPLKMIHNGVIFVTTLRRRDSIREAGNLYQLTGKRSAWFARVQY